MGGGQLGWSRIGILATNSENSSNAATLCLSGVTVAGLHDLTAGAFSTVVHEFGHAAGLLHEFQRKDAQAICPDDWSESGEDDEIHLTVSETSMLKKFKSTLLKVGPPDFYSVMNYCHLDLLAANRAVSNLSYLDLKTLDQLYGHRDGVSLPQPEFIASNKKPDEALWLKEGQRLTIPNAILDALAEARDTPRSNPCATGCLLSKSKF